MSWARYWATRASAPLQASGATPLAARSWLTRLNWTPAAPPTLETGGAGFAAGFGRAATGGRAAGTVATAGGGVAVGRTLPARTGCPGWRNATVAVSLGRALATALCGVRGGRITLTQIRGRIGT